VLVCISIPTLGLLFLQNKEVQTKLTDYLTEQFSEKLNADLSVSSVHYSFFNRLQLYNVYMEDLHGDTLMYSEVVKIRIKRFRPDKKDIHFKRMSFDNAYLRLTTDEDRNSNMQFLVDSLKKDIPAEDKIRITVDNIEFNESHFLRLDDMVIPQPGGIDFSRLEIRNLNAKIDDYLFNLDTTYLVVKELQGIETTGFTISDGGFLLKIGKNFITFTSGWINTPRSKANIPVIDFRYSDPKNFKYFYDSIGMYIASSNSWLDFEDISSFFPDVKNLSGIVNVNGSIQGTFGDIVGEKIRINYLDKTRMAFDMRMKGLPSQDSLFMDFMFREFETTRTELNKLTVKKPLALLNDNTHYNSLKRLNFSGSFTGYKNDFATTGLLKTNLGNLQLGLNMRPDTLKVIKINGLLGSDGFNLGTFLDRDKEIGDINFSVYMDGKSVNGKMEASLKGTIDTLGLYGYNYSNIELEGTASNRKFDGSLAIDDPNIDLQFTGSIDMEKEIPVFDFSLNVANLRPYYLHLQDDDPEYFASFLLNTTLTGRKLDEMNGQVHLVNSLLRRTGSQIQMYNVILNTMNAAEGSFISLNSDFIDGSISGTYDLLELPHLFTNLVDNHFHIFQSRKALSDSTATFFYKMNFKDLNPVLDFFFPGFTLANNMSVDGYYQTINGKPDFRFEGFTPFFAYNDLSIYNLGISVSSDSISLITDITGDSIATSGGLAIENPDIQAIFAENKNTINLQWSNDSAVRYSGDIGTSGQLLYPGRPQPGYKLQIIPSELYFKNRKFSIPNSFITVDSSGIAIDSFLIRGMDQYILAHGKYSDHIGDSLILDAHNLNMHMINDISKDFIMDIGGMLTGDMNFYKQEGKLMLTTDLIAENLTINSEPIGTTRITADWKRSGKQLDIRATSMGETSNRIFIDGSYLPRSGKLDFDLKLDKINLPLIRPYMSGILDDISGTSDFDLSLDGTIKQPVLNGTIAFNNARLTLSETKTRYTFSDNLRIYKNDIYFDNFEIRDQYNNILHTNGNIATANFKNIYLNLDLDATNFNFLATRRSDNEQFYGDIFASATAKINGPPDKLKVAAFATTEKYTSLKLPLYNSSEITSSDFVTFISREEDDVSPEKVEYIKKNKLTLDMELNVENNASVQLIFDPKVGDIIEASGNGTLKLEIDDNGDFSMFGGVNIQDGEYLFTLQNVINKRFRVKPGGTITWSGSPTSASIDLDAIYQTKASPYYLSPNPTEAMKKPIPVYCLLKLQGDLANPNLTPSIELPTAEPETRSLVETSTGTDEELMKQFISLLVINSFIVNTGDQIGGRLPGGAGVTASELLSNQLSNWFSQLSNDFDIGVNIRPGDALSSEEVELILRTQLFNDRVIFSGNLDYLGEEIDNPVGQPTNIVGDFDLEFLASDKISFKAFNRVNDDRIWRPSLYTQGVGIVYRSQFNSISEIFGNKKTDDTPPAQDSTKLNTEAVQINEPEIPPRQP